MSCTGFSQTLQPIVQQIDNQDYFCFNLKQSQFIGRALAFKSYTDSINIALEKQVFVFKKENEINDEIIHYLKLKHNTLDTINKNNHIIIKRLNNDLKIKDNKIKRHKVSQLFMGIGLVILSTIIVTN